MLWLMAILWQTAPIITTGLTAAQDWNNRINAAGVVWSHPFNSANEVNNFRWTPGYASGNDPLAVGSALAGNTRQISTDGPAQGFGCLEIVMPASASNQTSYWYRPMSPLVSGTTTGNGQATSDPGDGGAITAQSWPVSDGSGTLSGWIRGYYANSSNTGSTPNSTWDGQDFYFQVRRKVDININATAGNRAAVDSNGGKSVWITICKQTGVCQEIVTVGNASDGGSAGQSGIAPPTGSSRNDYLFLYRTTSGWPLQWDKLHLKGDLSSTGSQPGSQYPATLSSPYNGYLPMLNGDVGSVTNGDWHAALAYPLGQWCTFLYHVVPGTYSGTVSNSATTNQNNGTTDTDTQIQIWYAAPGATSYVKVFDKSDISYAFDFQYGWNAINLANFPDSGQTFDTAFYHRYGQAIFSRKFIACPQV